MVCLESFVWAVHLDKGREQLTIHHFFFRSGKTKSDHRFVQHPNRIDYDFIFFHEIDACLNQTYPL